MTVSPIDGWRLRGCGIDCRPRQHDPHAHELYGLLMALRTPPVRVVRTGPLVVDLDGRKVTVHGTDVPLSAREWGILAYLAERVGRFCPTEEILAAVWGPEWVTGARHTWRRGGSYRADIRAVTVPLYRLRGKLGDARPVVASVKDHGVYGLRLERVEPIPDPASLPPPHGPDHRDCRDCERLRVAIGHVPLDEMERERCSTG